MEYSNLSNLIIKVQSGDKDAMLYIIEKFSPLIKHYARSISVEDAFEELELALLNIVSRLHTDALAIDNEYTILSYLKKSIRNHSFDLQKKNQSNKFILDAHYIRKQHNITSLADDFHDYYSCIFWSEVEGVVTQQEYRILLLYFVYQFKCSEIAFNLNISRQAVNSSKKRAIQKLNSVYTSDMV